MPRTQGIAQIPSLAALDRAAGRLGQQLAQGLRQAIVHGEAKAGEPLPSTRALAASLGLSRGTVVEAYEQLIAEGYLEARAGAGTRVAASLRARDARARSGTAARSRPARAKLPPRAARYVAVMRSL